MTTLSPKPPVFPCWAQDQYGNVVKILSMRRYPPDEYGVKYENSLKHVKEWKCDSREQDDAWWHFCREFTLI